MSTILNLINGMRKLRSDLTPTTEIYIASIEAAELRRIELEAKYSPTATYRLASVSFEPAKAWLAENGLILDVIEHGPMWAIVELNAVEVGVLAERHIVGVPYDPNAPKTLHAFDEGWTDYDRIG